MKRRQPINQLLKTLFDILFMPSLPGLFDPADPLRFFVLHSSGAFDAIDAARERKP